MEIEEALVEQKIAKQTRKVNILEPVMVSNTTKLWLAQQSHTYTRKGDMGCGRKVKTKPVTRNTRRKRKIEHRKLIRTTAASQAKKKKKLINQFSQLVDQTLSFRRERSSPAARIAQMRSNKHYKPGD